MKGERSEGPTILAVATPPGTSHRGMIRISGPESRALIDGVLHGRAATAGVPLAPRLFHSAILDLAGLPLPVLVLAFAAPRSYTGEDVIELQMPGHPFLLDRVLERLIAGGIARGIDVRRAEAGEYTARAFLNGRMTLIQAEGIAATIAAQSDAELRAAHLLTSGRMGTIVRLQTDELTTALALVEAGIDFSDQEDVVTITPADLLARLRGVQDALATQLAGAVSSEQLEAIPWVVLSGRANAGKSTLFNALLEHERAVVSERPGTTRDVLTEALAIPTPHGPAEVMLVDVAGTGGAATSLDEEMHAAARAARQRAELVLRCVPCGDPEPATHDPLELLVRTKSDLLRPPAERPAGIVVSAVSGAGLETLRAAIADRLAGGIVSLASDALVLQPRHQAALRAARDALAEAVGLIERASDPPALADAELVAAAMRIALDELGQLVGDITPEDVLGRIFATFCIGK